MITILRGTHRNEYSSFILAERVYQLLENAHNVELVTVPYEQTIDYMIRMVADSNDPRLAIKTLYERLQLNIEEGDSRLEEWHSYQSRSNGGKLVLDSDLHDKDSLYRLLWMADGIYEYKLKHEKGNGVFSFHNYPISPIKKVYTSSGDSACVIRPKFYGRLIASKQVPLDLHGEISIFAVEDETLRYIEIPAFYDLDNRIIENLLMEDTLYESYLYNVDIEETRGQGLLDDKIVDKIAAGILRVASGEHDFKIE